VNLNANKTLNEDNSLSNTRIDRSLSAIVRFCLSFDPEASVQSREAIVTIHQEAIKYVNESADRQTGSKAPSNISFLDVVTEFSSRLTLQDKKSILAEMDKAFAKRAIKIEINNRLPYYAY
jgi:cohesin complex subunit SA-1/2